MASSSSHQNVNEEELSQMVEALQVQEEMSEVSSHETGDSEPESDTEEDEPESGDEQEKKDEHEDKPDKGDGASAPNTKKSKKSLKWSEYLNEDFIDQLNKMNDEELAEFIAKHFEETKVCVAKLNHAKALSAERKKEKNRLMNAERRKEKAEQKKQEGKVNRETVFQLSVVLPDGSTHAVDVSNEMTMATLRDKCASLMSMKKKDYKLVRLLVRGQDIAQSNRTTIGGNKITKDSRVEVSLTVKGGGKRAKSSPGDVPKSKSSLMKNLKHEIGGKLVLVPDANVAPIISITKGKVLSILNAIDQKDNQVVAKMVKDLPKEVLKKLATDVIPASTRVPDRCRGVCDIIFEKDVENLEEAEFHKKTILDTLHLAIQYSIVAQFADQSGTISWTAFLTTISDILSTTSSTTSDTTMG